MKTYKWHIAIDRCEKTGETEVEDDATVDEIKEQCWLDAICWVEFNVNGLDDE